MNSKEIKTIIVDDESRIRRGIEKLVLACGEEWKVIATFGDGQELIEAYQQDPLEFDVLITDIRMPVMDGLTLIKEMKRLTTFSPVVISGFDDFTYLQTALREGALDYIMKPIDREEFKHQLESLKQKIKSKWEDQEQLAIIKDQASELTYTKQVEKLNEVTKGYEFNVSLLDWTKGFPEGFYTLMNVTIDRSLNNSKSMTKEEWNTWVLANENIVNELLSDCKSVYWKWRGEESSFWILLCSTDLINEEFFKDKVHEFACLVQQNVRLYTPFSNSIAISKVFTDLTLLQTVTKDVLTLLQYRLVFGNNQILQQDMEEKLILESEMKSASELQQLIQRIIQALERMNEKELIKHIHLFAEEIQSLRLPNEIEFFLQSLSIQLINHLIKFSPRLNNDLLDIQDTARLLKNTGNFAELQTELEQWVMTIYKKLLIVNKEKVLNQVEVAKAWIIENLKENITIEKIARHVYMNPTYFCEYFKNETGETVLDFVTSSRINKARDLLITTNLKVYEISEQVGYADTKYFSKLFKKHYGELPSKYKEKM